MKLLCVTMTGADEDTDIGRMTYLSRRYPFVEWGILISATRSGNQKRYPCKTWINHLIGGFQSERVYPKLAYHVCGRLASDLLAGTKSDQWDDFLPDLDYGMRRMQINVNLGRVKKYSPREMALLLWGMSNGRDDHRLQYIVQYNKANSTLWSDLVDHGMIPNILFDASGGRGVFPITIPKPIPGLLCGYAGGLNPSNVGGFIESLDKVLGSGITWIDMESGVRNDQDEFDLDKVEDVLDMCEKYVVRSNRRRV